MKTIKKFKTLIDIATRNVNIKYTFNKCEYEFDMFFVCNDECDSFTTVNGEIFDVHYVIDDNTVSVSVYKVDETKNMVIDYTKLNKSTLRKFILTK